jgi:ketose-bisphosphate aldolase
MPLISSKDILSRAREGRYAVTMFDVCNYEMIRGVVEAAEELSSPVMLGALKPDLEGRGLDYFIAMARVAAEKSSVPVAIHLDHATDIASIKRVVDAGFNSVMIDASSKSFDENIRIVKEVVDYAHSHNITVEAELGHVPDAIAGTGEAAHQTAEKDPKDSLTHPDDVVEFVSETGDDALAVAIGTAHGSYFATPELDIELLKEINSVSDASLVLHGGSGTPEDQIRKAIENGITKINVFTDILIAYYTELRSGLKKSDNMGIWPIFVNKKPLDAMKAVVMDKIRQFGSEAQA